MRLHRPNSLSHSSLWERPKDTVTICDEKLLSCTNQEMDIKKISKPLKIPISTIMEIIKKFKATGDVKNQPGRGPVCKLTPRTMRRMVRLAKESLRITAGELQRLVESWGQKVSKTTIRRHLHHHKLFLRVARKKASAVNQQQTKAPTVCQM